jgi:ferredoxin-nitrite reductase
LVLTGVPDDRIEDLLEEDLLDRHSPSPAPFERGVMACTGSDFCRYALVETKARAAQWAREMDRRFAAQIVELPGARGRSDSGVVRMHFSGCSASCAQPQIADIGFRGETAHAGDKIVEAVDIGLGGSLGPDSAFGDWVEGAVPVDDVMGALGRLMDRYFEERRPEEPIYEWVRRSERSELRSTLRGGGPDEVAGGGSHLSQDQPGP